MNTKILYNSYRFNNCTIMNLFARFVGIWMVFVIYIVAGVEGVAYGVNCSGDVDCTEANNVCASTKCACSPTSFKTDGANTCAKKFALNRICTASPTGQCAKTNAECHATRLKCECTSSFFANKKAVCASQVTALDATCVATETAADQCAVTNSECRNDGAGSKCLCKTSHYKDGTGCVIKKKPEETCAVHQCVTHATCNTTSNPTKCQCNAGYTATPATKPTMCSGVIKVATLSYMLMVPIFVSMMSLLR